jgi:sulfur relay (sulfurtransferase) DsrF/TusC family protein
MKNAMLSLVALFLSLALRAQTADENLAAFFKNEGVVDLAQCAHPFNTYKQGYYTVYDSYVLVQIYYEDNYRIKLQIDRSGLFLSKITVLEDNDWAEAFSATKTIKDWLLDAIKDKNQDTKTLVQQNMEALR